MALKLITILADGSFDEAKVLKQAPSDAITTVDFFDDNTGVSFEAAIRFNLLSGTSVTLDNLEMDGVLKRQQNR